MNAVTPILTELAFKNASLLRALRTGGHDNLSAIAEAIGRDKSNVHKSFKLLVEAGLADDGDGHALTRAGLDQVDALDRSDNPSATGDTLPIPFSLIDPWPDNPRTQFDDATTEDLARSIGDQGVLQPLIVRPKGERFEVIIGERRRRASALAVARGWQAAEFAVPCRIRELDDGKAEEIAGVENIQREDMHWMDEARWLKRLAERGRSGAEIERIVGGARKKRSIQDYIKCARELSAEDVARTYLADGDKDQLTYVRARDLVGDKKERPALDLTPKMAVALLEIIAAGLAQRSIATWAQGETIVTRFSKAVIGGPIQTLVDRKLVVFGFVERQIVSRTQLGEDVCRWLKQLAFDDDPLGALWRTRAAVIGELQTNVMERDGLYLTAELNPLKPAEPLFANHGQALAAEAAGGPPAAEPPWMGEDEARSDDDEAAEYGDDGEDDDEETAEPQAGVSPTEREEPTGLAASPAPARSPVQAAVPPELPAMLAIVVIEAAHKIATSGIQRGPGTWAAPVLTSYYLDRRGSDLVTSHKMLAFFPAASGVTTLVALGKAGRDWLWERWSVGETAAGQVEVPDATLARAQTELMGGPPKEGRYTTPWLNPPAEAAAESLDAPGPTGADAGTPGDGLDTPTPDPKRGDSFTQQILGLAAERRAKHALAGAARQAREFIASLAARSKPPKREEIDPMVALLDAALEAMAPHLEPETGE